MLYLIQKTMVGEPVGIHAKDGTSYFWPLKEQFAAVGKTMVSFRGTNVPWDVFVDHRAGAVDHRTFWGALETTSSIEEALTEARDTYFTG
jgi:hypothetical protein